MFTAYEEHVEEPNENNEETEGEARTRWTKEIER